jgi:hypothetical protein
MDETNRYTLAIAEHLVSFVQRRGIPLEQAVHEGLELWRQRQRREQLTTQYLQGTPQPLLDPKDFDEADREHFLDYLE